MILVLAFAASPLLWPVWMFQSSPASEYLKCFSFEKSTKVNVTVAQCFRAFEWHRIQRTLLIPPKVLQCWVTSIFGSLHLFLWTIAWTFGKVHQWILQPYAKEGTRRWGKNLANYPPGQYSLTLISSSEYISFLIFQPRWGEIWRGCCTACFPTLSKQLSTFMFWLTTKRSPGLMLQSQTLLVDTSLRGSSLAMRTTMSPSELNFMVT